MARVRFYVWLVSPVNLWKMQHAQVPRRAPRRPGDNEGKERITIRIDAEMLAWLRGQVKGGGNCEPLINETLRAHIAERDTR